MQEFIRELPEPEKELIFVQYLPDFFTVFIENLKLRFILYIRKGKLRIAAFKERMKLYERIYFKGRKSQ